MRYPAIVYSLARMHNRAANNHPTYQRYDSYTVTYITPKVEQTRADNPLERLLSMQWAVFDRTYVMDNLHHYVFTVYLG